MGDLNGGGSACGSDKDRLNNNNNNNANANTMVWEETDDECGCAIKQIDHSKRHRTRMLLLLIAAIFPIILISFLLTNPNVINLWHTHWTAVTYGSEESGVTVLDIGALRPPCEAIPFRVTDIIDVEGSDIFKDVRTSFLPSETAVIPPNCLTNDDHLSIVHQIFDPQQQTITQLLNYLRLRRDVDDSDAATAEVDQDGDVIKDFITSAIESTTATIISTTTPTTVAADATESTVVTESTSEDIIQSPLSSFWTENSDDMDAVRETQASIMKRYMDTTADPCEDFYQYACGNWEKLNPIPKDRAAYDTFEMLRESLDLVLKELLENSTIAAEATTAPATAMTFTITDSINGTGSGIWPQRLDNATTTASMTTTAEQHTVGVVEEGEEAERIANVSSAEMKAINLYKSCINYGILDKRGTEPLLKLLQSLGGWPVLMDADQWNADDFNWLRTTAELRLYNNDIFIIEWVGPDIKNSQENIIQFDQTSLGLPSRDYFLQATNAEYLNAYQVFMSDIIHLLGVPLVRAKAAAQEIVDFERELARITQVPEERTNVTQMYRQMTLQELHQLIPGIDWTQYLEIVLQRPMNQSERVVMFATNFMKDLVKLIDRTENRTVANYLLWRFVRHRVNNLDDRFVGAKQRFYLVLFGREESPPRWKTCVNQVNSNMGMAVGAMFVRKYFDELSKQDTMTMTHDLQDAFREILNGTDWIDEGTKGLAEEKVNAMSLRIGYPDYILVREELDEKYATLVIHPQLYFENTLNVLKHITWYEHNKLTEVVNKTSWHTAPAVVNAYYSRNKNQIMFPSGILQPPFYHKHFPKSLNYGGIGVVIGHELTHGFDDKGRLFDQNGNLVRWWSESAVSNFNERASCLIMQYSNYTITDIGAIDGVNTQGENLADHGGVKQAFRAYQKWYDKQSGHEMEVLPGLNATNAQLFFLNFAQIWCGAMRPEATKNKLKTAVHSPGKFRVIGTLSNSEDFAKAFNCPLGTTMNPAQKCTVW